MLKRKITAVVPIKLNNERVPGKNTKILGGRPMISYILQALLDCNRCDEIYVYCSQESIIPYLPDGVKFKKGRKIWICPQQTSHRFLSRFLLIFLPIFMYMLTLLLRF